MCVSYEKRQLWSNLVFEHISWHEVVLWYDHDGKGGGREDDENDVDYEL